MSTVLNVAEALGWFAQGRTYAWMSEEYERRYNLLVGASTWSDLALRHEAGVARDDSLIPWSVRAEHRWSYDFALLRMESRKRMGSHLTFSDEVRLAKWHERLDEDGVVLHYEPETARGFRYVPRRPGIDRDVIRSPEGRAAPREVVD